MTIVVTLAFVAAALVIVAYPFYRTRARAGPSSTGELDTLRERREAALSALHEVEFDYRVGKLSEQDYQTLRAQMRARALGALHEYDESYHALDEQIENEVRALRAARPKPAETPVAPARPARVERACANCGRTASAEDLFCARCGTRLPERAAARSSLPAARGQGTASKPAPRGMTRGWLIGGGIFAAAWVGLAGFLYWNAAGAARTQTPIGTLGATETHSVALSPSNPNIVYVGQHDGVRMSADGGRNWAPLDVKGDVMTVALSPAAPTRVFIAGHNVFARSDDGGKTWRAVSNDLPSQDIHALAVLPNAPDVLYAALADQGLYLSEDGGARWQAVARGLPNSVTALAALPGNPDRFYVGTQGGGVWMSMDAGVTWQSGNGFVSGALRGGNVNALALDFTTEGLYAGTEEGLSLMANMSSGWIRRNFNGAVAALALSDDGLTVVVVDGQGQVFRSTDRGVTWRAN